MIATDSARQGDDDPAPEVVAGIPLRDDKNNNTMNDMTTTQNSNTREYENDGLATMVKHRPTITNMNTREHDGATTTTMVEHGATIASLPPPTAPTSYDDLLQNWTSPSNRHPHYEPEPNSSVIEISMDSPTIAIIPPREGEDIFLDMKRREEDNEVPVLEDTPVHEDDTTTTITTIPSRHAPSHCDSGDTLLTADVTVDDDDDRQHHLARRQDLFEYDDPVYNEYYGTYGVGGAAIVVHTDDDTDLEEMPAVVGTIVDEDAEREERSALRRRERRAVGKVLCGAACFVTLALSILLPVGTFFFGNKYRGTQDPTAAPTVSPTVSPSASPTSSRFELLGERLSGVSDPSLLQNKTTPQFRARTWLADGDDVPLDAANLVQRYVLAVFYYSTDGDGWALCSQGSGCRCEDDGSATVACGSVGRSVAYLNTDDECTWYRNRCDEWGRLTHMKFEYVSNAMRGTLPDELRHLTSLQTLSLGNNLNVLVKATQKKLPQAVAILNKIHGTIPDYVGGMENLTTLVLARNRFDGTIPDALYTLRSLRLLRLDGNGLSGRLSPHLGRLAELRSADFSNNVLEGSVPAEIGNLMQLDDLNLVSNEFTGTMPEGVCALVESVGLQTLTADCDKDNPEVECDCCTGCIDEGL